MHEKSGAVPPVSACRRPHTQTNQRARGAPNQKELASTTRFPKIYRGFQVFACAEFGDFGGFGGLEFGTFRGVRFERGNQRACLVKNV